MELNNRDKNSIHCMIDMETLSLEPNAVIFSIGATAFSLDGKIIDTFYALINPELEENTKNHDISSSTLQWWNEQEEEAKIELEKAKKTSNTISDVLKEFNIWYLKNNCSFIWSMGSISDVMWLETSLKIHNIEQIHNYTEVRCFRTIRDMFSTQELINKSLIRADIYSNYKEDFFVKHNALSDALLQTFLLLSIYND